MSTVLCWLCNNPVTVKDACYGCRKLICDEHTGEPEWGEHDPTDHLGAREKVDRHPDNYEEPDHDALIRAAEEGPEDVVCADGRPCQDGCAVSCDEGRIQPGKLHMIGGKVPLPEPGEIVEPPDVAPCTSAADAKPSSDRQHTRPCGDCPWRRTALAGWLGRLSIDRWLQAAHGETLVDCHGVDGPQCAGIAIYRANMAKRCRDPSILKLDADRDAVFASPNEFQTHHERKEKT